MFCDGCGTAVQADQAFCSRCGKQIVGGVIAMQPRRGRVGEHARLLGILWLAISAFHIVVGVAMLMMSRIMPILPGSPHIPAFVQPLIALGATFVFAKAALGFIVGWGLLQRESWARILALVLGFIALFSIPFGTALGIYTLWVLLPSESQKEYEALTARTAA